MKQVEKARYLGIKDKKNISDNKKNPGLFELQVQQIIRASCNKQNCPVTPMSSSSSS